MKSSKNTTEELKVDKSSMSTKDTMPMNGDEDKRARSELIKGPKASDYESSEITKRTTLDPKEQKVLADEASSNDNQNLEKHLVVAKMNWANAELKIDLQKEEIKSLKRQVKMLEYDLVKTKQNLGEAMNAVYEYERK